MEEKEIFLDTAIQEENISKVWHVFLEEEAGSKLKKKAAEAYLKLCKTPVQMWALYSNSGVNEETKEAAWEKLEEHEERRREYLKKAIDQHRELVGTD